MSSPSLGGDPKRDKMNTDPRNPLQKRRLKLCREHCRQLLPHRWSRRPPRNPVGVLRTFIIMRMKGVRSLREMERILDVDQRLRRLCLIKASEAAYPRSVLSRFIRNVGEDNLNKIIEQKVIKLLKNNDTRDFDAVFDASFIKAWSIRYPYCT